jgi:hypothetical protein
MKRPSSYVLVCAVLVLTTFSASGHLRLGSADPQRADAPGRLRLPPPARTAAMATVAGSVLDTMGFRLVGADVSTHAASTRTDADGMFRLDVPRGTVADLRISSPNHRPLVVRAWASAGEALVTALEPVAPWELATVAARTSTTALVTAVPTTALPPGAAAGAIDATPAPESSRAAESTGPIGEGFVRTRDGAALGGALIVVTETGAMARTDAAGRYEIALPATAATLLVHQPDGGRDELGWAARAEPFTPQRARGRVPLPDVEAWPALALRGTVRDGGGQPQKGVPLQIVGDGFARTIASGDGGAFRLGGLLPGRYELRAFAFRGALGATTAIDLAGPITDCEVHLRAVPERRLQVVTERGDPVPRAIVATSVDGVRREVVRSDGEGWVQVRAAQPAASYDVRTADDYRPMRVVTPPNGPADRLVVALP